MIMKQNVQSKQVQTLILFMHEKDLSQQQKEYLHNNMKEHKSIQAEDSKIMTQFELMCLDQNKHQNQTMVLTCMQYTVKNSILSGQIDEEQRQKMAKQNRTYNAELMIKFTLSNCQFTNLKYLKLGQSQIATIEFIGFLDAVNLTKLDLSHNFITNFKSLNKTNFKHLQSIIFEGNPSRSIINFQRMKFSHILLNVHFEPRQDYDVMMENICQLLKFQCNIIYFLLIKSRKRIRQKSLYQQLKQKYMITNDNGEIQNIYIFVQQHFDSL